jgi:hypothetical protein
MKTLPIDFYIHAGMPFSPNFHIRFPDTPAFLNGYVSSRMYLRNRDEFPSAPSQRATRDYSRELRCRTRSSGRVPGS